MKTLLEESSAVKRLTGLTAREFARANTAFTAICRDEHCWRTIRGRPRYRAAGAGLPSALVQPESKLLFVLVYHNIHPSQKALGQLFGMTQQWASDWIVHLTPMVSEALGRPLAMTTAKPISLAELLQLEPRLPSFFRIHASLPLLSGPAHLHNELHPANQ